MVFGRRSLGRNSNPFMSSLTDFNSGAAKSNAPASAIHPIERPWEMGQFRLLIAGIALFLLAIAAMVLGKDLGLS
ncbi:hypothetical protein, partial [Rhizobium johnstonii]|uniref:hypothetical protein n=1 Tax=Rhizobium johnstonii TaxID=3019933 RepID=UPI003F99B2A0